MPALLSPPYLLTNHLALLPPRAVPRLAIDDAVPFVPGAALLYLALFPLMWWAVLAQPDARQARRLVLSAACCAWAVSAFFLLVPTSYPRPAGPIVATAYAWVVAIDTPRNAFPSLHGTYAVLSAAWIARARGMMPWGALAWVAAAAILAATMMVKQHGVIDLAAGATIGALAVACCRREPA